MQAMFRQIQRGPTANDYKDSAELRSQSPKNGLIPRQSAGGTTARRARSIAK